MRGIHKIGIVVSLLLTITTASAITEIGNNLAVANNVTALNFLGNLSWVYLSGKPADFPNSTISTIQSNETEFPKLNGSRNVTGNWNWGGFNLTNVSRVVASFFEGNGSKLSSLNASNLTGTLGVASGGTGQTTQAAAFNALSPTTTKGDLIVNDSTNDIRFPVGANYQVLISNSTDTDGLSWGLPNGTLINVQTLTTGTTTYTPTAGTKQIIIELRGGGASGGGVSGTASGAGGGGGSGGYAMHFLDPVTAASYTVAISGTAAGNSGAAGTNGGITTFNTGVVTITANGGVAGAYVAGSTTNKAAMGGAGAAISTNANLVNGAGYPGNIGFTFTSAILAYSGNGGSTSLGGGGVGRATSGAGTAAVANTGSGGGGACAVSAAAAAGGQGAAGRIIVWEYT